MKEKNYDFRARHWTVHQPDRRNPERKAAENELMLDEKWALGCSENSEAIVLKALKDFQDYLYCSMNLSLKIVHKKADYVVWFDVDSSLDNCFQVKASEKELLLLASEGKMVFRGSIHLEDCMSLEGAPVVPLAGYTRRPLYNYRNVHSGTGLDEFPDAELNAALHAGYDMIVLFVKGFDQSAAGYRNFNDIIKRAKSFGLDTMFYNYMPSFKHPDEEDAEEFFDSIYGELFRRYPDAAGICMVGESMEFPSKDPATTGKKWRDSLVDGIPDTRPSPGWHPCSDYPAYISAVKKAIHAVKPDAKINFSTYNWGYTPLELRKKFLQNLPEGITLEVCYEIFSEKTLEGLNTPIMDYTILATEPGYYFSSECETAHSLGIPVTGNVNTAGISWTFGCVPYVPVPQRWLKRNLNLRKARKNWGVTGQYTTHHYGWWNSVAAELGRWTAWEDFEPDYDELLQKIALRDYGKAAASAVLQAWETWSQAMDFYIASNEDQYGPWRVGPAYPFIFQPNMTRTMAGREIKFPTAEHAHFGHSIIKTLYQPYENEHQSPGFLRYPAELRSLAKMLKGWEEGIEKLDNVPAEQRNRAFELLYALGGFIRNSIKTTMNIKEWWLKNMELQTAKNAQNALQILDEIEQILQKEKENAIATIPFVETDSRIGWEASMEYVCDPWHLNWKLRQLEHTERELEKYRKILSC